VIDATQAALFAVAAGALVMAPGPDMLLVLGRALGHGRLSGTPAAFPAARLSNALARKPRVVHGLNIGAGVVFLLCGLKIATLEQPR